MSDIDETVAELWRLYHHLPADRIVKQAIINERKRCARIAAQTFVPSPPDEWGEGYNVASHDIEAAIRA